MTKSNIYIGDLVKVSYDTFSWYAVVIDTMRGEPNASFDQDYCVVLTIPDNVAAYCYSYTMGCCPLYAKFNVCLISAKICGAFK